MKKKQKNTVLLVVAAIIVIAAVSWVLIKWPVSTWRGILDDHSFENVVVPTGWQSYVNSQYGFSLSYPGNWQVNTNQLQNDVPAVLFGDPIEGTSTYVLRVSIAKNDNSLSSDGYVADMLARAKAEDVANAKNGPAPQISVAFANATAFAVNENQGYELDNVFEFDHNAEQVYMAHDKEVLVFDFPVADQNPNISSSTENNAMVHEILKTVRFGN